jgi:4a-hydroxytetrahydrobiopterin dehydratase
MAVLSEAELTQGMVNLADWRVEGDTIVREYTFEGGFMGSVGFVNRLAAAAEVADHHPDLAISWNRVTVTLSTHSEGGITQKDLDLAAEADRLAA